MVAPALPFKGEDLVSEGGVDVFLAEEGVFVFAVRLIFLEEDVCFL